MQDKATNKANRVGGEIALRQLRITDGYMIDRESRDRMAPLLQDWLDGRISIENLLDSVPRHSQDPVIAALVHGLEKIPCGALRDDCGEWQTCSDPCPKCRKHKGNERIITMSHAKQCLKRAVIFLRTDQEYTWPPQENTDTEWREILKTLPKAIGIAVLILGTLVLTIWGVTELFGYMVKHGYSEDRANQTAGFLFALWPISLVGFIVYTNKQSWSADWGYWPFHDRRAYEAATASKTTD